MTRPVTFLGLISTNIVSMDSIYQGIYKFELLPHYHLPLLSVLLGWRPYFLADYSLLKKLYWTWYRKKTYVPSYKSNLSYQPLSLHSISIQ